MKIEFGFYKKEYARISRAILGGVLAVWVFFGAKAFHDVILGTFVNNWRDTFIVGEVKYLSYGYVTAAVVCALGWAVSYFFVINNRRLTDFLIKTEAEMKKVSWPSRREVFISSTVVLFVIVVLGGYLFGLDTILERIVSALFKQ